MNRLSPLLLFLWWTFLGSSVAMLAVSIYRGQW